MSHPKELIDSVLALLRPEYPSDTYHYRTEECVPTTRFFPDIAIYRPGDNAVPVCAVEIGYTRPEKLTGYRKMGIPDVRWYDKQGNLHADVREVVVRPRVVWEPPSRIAIYSWNGTVACWEDGCEGYEEYKFHMGLDERATRRPQLFARYERRYGRPYWGLDGSVDDAYETMCIDVMMHVLTDGVRIWCPAFCDKCAANFYPDDPLDMPLEFDDLATDASFVTATDWDGAVQFVDDRYDLPLIYEDGRFFDGQTSKSIGHQVRVAVDAARVAQ